MSTLYMGADQETEGCCTNAPTEEQLLEKAKTFE